MEDNLKLEFIYLLNQTHDRNSLEPPPPEHAHIYPHLQTNLVFSSYKKENFKKGFSRSKAKYVWNNNFTSFVV